MATNVHDDVFVQSLPETLQPPAPTLVTGSGTQQTVSSVAAGANGYAVAWSEHGPDNLAHNYVRRFSESGVAQDAPIPLVSAIAFNFLQTTIVSNGETYLVGWQADDAFFIRRLDAAGGQWIDPEPISLGLRGSVSLASNGKDAVAFGSIGCGTVQCLATRRISLTGAPLTSPPVTIRALGLPIVASGVVGSNGTDYLAVSFEQPSCMFDPCLPNPGKIYATRLRADGTAIDAQPMQLSAADRPVQSFTIAWADGRYLVAWTDIDGVRGARVTDEGAVLDRDPNRGGVLLAAGQNYSLGAVAAGVGRQFVLLLNRISSSTDGYVSTLEGVAFDARADLASVPALARTIVAPAETNFGRNAVAVGRGYTFAAAYDRLSAEAGNVPRVFLRLFAEPVPRRRAAR